MITLFKVLADNDVQLILLQNLLFIFILGSSTFITSIVEISHLRHNFLITLVYVRVFKLPGKFGISMNRSPQTHS